MGSTFEELARARRGSYAKDEGDEQFLQALNEDLHARELALYRDVDVEHPFVFVLGLPRSGTTLTSQLLAYCLDAGYIDNVAARFWLAPVHGIRLARLIAGGGHGETSFLSDHARTPGLADIHEFGYFWRHWLRKHTFDDVVEARAREGEIDWTGLRRTLANVQHELGKPFVAKNVLASYHLAKVREVLGPVVWVYVERDPLDVCISILEARRTVLHRPAPVVELRPARVPPPRGSRRVGADRRPGALSRALLRAVVRGVRPGRGREGRLRGALRRSGRRPHGRRPAKRRRLRRPDGRASRPARVVPVPPL